MTDFSFAAAAVRDEMLRAGMEIGETAIAGRRPHVLMRPAIYPDGNQWCALYGEDLMMGVCGFGDTPELACVDFDKNWSGQRLRVPASGGEGV